MIIGGMKPAVMQACRLALTEALREGELRSLQQERPKRRESYLCPPHSLTYRRPLKT